MAEKNYRPEMWGAAKPVRKGRKLPEFLREDEPEQLLRATTTQRDRLLLMTLLYAGLRVAELCALCCEHINFRARVLMVRQGKGQKDRAVPLSVRLAGPLRAWIGNRQTGPVFPSPRTGKAMTTRAVQYLIKRVAKAAGLRDWEQPRRISPHKLRHSFATRALDRGAPIHAVRDLLGHASLATTNTYAHASAALLREAVDL